MANTFYVKTNDTANTITATLKDRNGAIDLSGATVRFHMRPQGALTVAVNAEATVNAPATGGSVTYAWAPADIATPGTYECEWEITFADNTVLTVPDTGYDLVQIADDIA